MLWERSRGVKNDVFERAVKVANELNLPVVKTDSNISEAFIQNHLLTHDYTSMFAVFCLQKLWKLYFYGSSGEDFSCFNLKDNSKFDSAHYELLSFHCFSTQNLMLQIDGGAQNRLEKIKDIVDNEIVQKNLHVCLTDSVNCSYCSKCRRTMLMLDAIGKLDLYKEVFDIEKYKKNKVKYLRWLYREHLVGDIMNEPTYQVFKNKIGISTKILCNIKYFLSKVSKVIKNKKE